MFGVMPRDSLIRKSFEADLEYLGPRRNCYSPCFFSDQPITDWPVDGWLAASERQLEGRLDDVLATSGLFPVVSARFRTLAEELGVKVVQYLSLKVKDSNGTVLSTYYYMRLPLIEALDLEASNVGYSEGQLSHINSDGAVLKRKRVAGMKMWRSSELPVHFWASGEFVNWYRHNEFTGISFHEVRTSDSP